MARNHYFIINRETRQYSRVTSTKRAADSWLRKFGRDTHFIVAIPDKNLAGFSAAYIREHGTDAKPVNRHRVCTK